MKKFADMEITEVDDPGTGKTVAVSTTVRLLFRQAWPEKYGDMRNSRLNYEIAKDFIANSGNVLHYFRLGTGDESGTGHSGVAEIRAGGSSFFYISAIRSKSIDILTMQADWIRPKYEGSADNPLVLGEE